MPQSSASPDIFDDVAGTPSASSTDIFDQVSGGEPEKTAAEKDFESKVQSAAIASVPKPAFLSGQPKPVDVLPTPLGFENEGGFGPPKSAAAPLPKYDVQRAVVGGLTDIATGGGMPSNEGAPPLGEPMAQGVRELETPGKRGTGALRVAATGAEALSPIMGPGALETGAAIEAAPSLTHAALRALPMTAGMGAGFGSSEAAGPIARKLGADPEQEELIKDLAFWVPSLAGAILQPKFGAAVSPKEVVVRGGVKVPIVGDVAAEVRIPRSQPPAPPAAIDEPIPNAPNAWEAAKGNLNPRTPLPPPPSDDPAVTSMANAHQAQDTAAKQAAGIPEPPPPTILDQPNAPPELKENRIAPESITRMASFVAGLPDAQRAQAVQEAHQTLTAALTEMGKKGPVSMPDGTLALVKDPKSAEKLAISIINDAVKAHDKVSASLSGEGERGKQTGAVSPKEAASGDIFDQAAQNPTATEKPSPAGQESQQPLKKGDTATLARDIDINGKTLAKGTPVTLTYVHPNGLLARATTEDGTKISRGVGAFTKGVESKHVETEGSDAGRVRELSGSDRGAIKNVPASTPSDSGKNAVAEVSSESPADTSASTKEVQEPKLTAEPEHPNLELGEHAAHTEMVPTKTVAEYGKDVEMLPVEELEKLATHDRRKEPFGTDMDELKADIQKNGIKEPLELGYNHAEKKAVIWDGNHRLGVARELNLRELPVRVVATDFPTAQYGKTVSGYAGEGKVPEHLKPSDIGIGGRAVKTEAQAPKEPAPSKHHDSPQPTTPDQNSAYQAPPNLALPQDKPSVAQPVKTEEKPKYKFGNTQANIPAESEASKSLESARARISETDLAGKGKDIGDGGNHVTVRYGIKGEDTKGIRKFLSEQAPFEARLGKTESFPPSEHSDGAAVIQAPIESPELHRLNAELEKHGEFTEPSFDEYKPHATIAYVKPDKVSRYVGMDVTHGKKFTVDEIAISKKDGSQEVVKLEGKAPAKKEASSTPAVVESGREKILESEIKHLQDQAAKVSEQFTLKSLTGYDPFSPLRKQYNDLLGQARAKEDELAKLRGEPTRAEKREAAKVAAEKKFADRPEKAMKYGDLGQSQHWQVQEPDYIDKRFTQEIARYKRAIPEQEARIKELGPKVSKQKRDIEESTVHFWKKILADTEARDPRKAQKFKEEYRKLVKEAVSHGSPVPQEVIGQLPEFKLAQDARERYEKGLHTSFANRSAAINDTMQKEEGFKVKRQDGKPITEAQMKEISTGVDEMVKVLGPELREMMRGTDLTISHTSGKHPFLSDAGGQYHPLDRSISAGINNFLGKPIKALAHETGHWLDFESGRVLNTKALIRPKSGGPSTETKYVSEADRSTKPLYELARQTMADTYRVRKLIKTTKMSDLPEAEREEIEVMKVVLGPYWHEPRELWARMFEQYVGTKFGRAGISMRSPEQYQSAPAYWPKEAWAKIEPLFEEALKTRMDAMRERYAPTTIKGESAAAPTPPPSAPEVPKPVVAEEAKPTQEEPTKAEKTFAADLNKKVSGLRKQIKELEKETSAPAAYYQDSAKNASERLKRTNRINQLSELRSELRDIEKAHKIDLAEKLTPEEKVPEAGKNFEGRYVRASLEPVKAAWLEKWKPREGEDVEDHWKWMVKNMTDATDKPADFSKGHLYIKVPDDGSFYIPNTPAAIDHALKAAGKFASSEVGEALPKGGPKKFRMTSPKEFDNAKYIAGLEKEIKDLENDRFNVGDIQKPYIEEQLKAARENLAEAKKPESILTGESGFADVIKPLEAAATLTGTVGNYVRSEAHLNKIARELHSGMYDLEAAHSAQVLRAVQVMEKAQEEYGDKLVEDAEAVYHHLENPEEPLNGEQDKLLDDTVIPIMEKTDENFIRLKELMGQDAELIENYVHRVVREKGGWFDRIASGATKGGTGRGNLLSKSAPQAKGRTMMALEADNVGGRRVVVAIKGNRVTAFRNGQTEDFGPLSSGLTTKYELQDKRLGPLADRIIELQKQIAAVPGEDKAKRIAAIDAKVSDLRKERDILADVKGRKLGQNAVYGTEVTFGKRKAITEKIEELEKEKQRIQQSGHMSNAGEERVRRLTESLRAVEGQRNRVLESVPTDQLMDRLWVDKDGKRWKITQATTKEIEANTDLAYWHNGLASALVSNLQVTKALRGAEFIEAFKSSPEFEEIAQKQGTGNPPAGWRTTQLPQLRDYSFEPHVAEVLDWYADRLRGNDPSIWDKVGQFLRTSIFFNPLIHVPNITVHFGVERGLTGYNPLRFPEATRAGLKAINAVIHQNEDFLAALESGAPLQSHREDTAKITQLFFDQLSGGLEKKEDWALDLAKRIGMSPVDLIKGIYRFSGKVTWVTNDIAVLQSAYEKQARTPGMSLKEALRETTKHIPDYRLPTRMFNSRALAKVLSNPNVSMFMAYHYGAAKSYGEAAKSALGMGGGGNGGSEPPLSGTAESGAEGEGAPRGRSKAAEIAHGWEILATIGLVTFVLYPLLDKLVQAATGDKKAKLRRAGAATLPYNIYQAATKQKSVGDVVQSVATPAVQTKTAAELIANRDFFTGRNIYDSTADWETQGKQVGRFLMQAVSPVGQASRAIEGGPEGRKRFAWGLVGVSFPKTKAEHLAQQIAMSKAGTKAETPQAREDYVERRDILEELRKGNHKPLEEARAKHLITPKQAHTIESRAKLSPLADTIKGFSYSDARSVYELADESERKQLDQVMRAKRARMFAAHRGAEVRAER